MNLYNEEQLLGSPLQNPEYGMDRYYMSFLIGGVLLLLKNKLIKRQSFKLIFQKLTGAVLHNGEETIGIGLQTFITCFKGYF